MNKLSISTRELEKERKLMGQYRRDLQLLQDERTALQLRLNTSIDLQNV
jgi:hypothetical protein